MGKLELETFWQSNKRLVVDASSRLPIVRCEPNNLSTRVCTHEDVVPHCTFERDCNSYFPSLYHVKYESNMTLATGYVPGDFAVDVYGRDERLGARQTVVH
jgi:hypothetical protein